MRAYFAIVLLVWTGMHVYVFWRDEGKGKISADSECRYVIVEQSPLPDLGAISTDGLELLGIVSIDNVQEQICVFSILTGSHRQIGDLIAHDPVTLMDAVNHYDSLKSLHLSR